jgi:hypothetical protein
MAEISRVLKPGGVFVASTFLTPLAPLGELIGDLTVRPLSQVSRRCNHLRGLFGVVVCWPGADAGCCRGDKRRCRQSIGEGCKEAKRLTYVVSLQVTGAAAG